MGNDKKPADPVRAHIRAQIDENLRRVYHANMSEDLPDRFKDLLSKLRVSGGSTKDGET
jgi:Anti-sigma factor NepR